MAKNKAPADQFYFGDYIRDTRCLSIGTRGAWMDILAFGFFSTPQGRMTKDLDAWSRLFGTSTDTTLSIFEELKKHEVGDVVTQRNGDITVTNRRKYGEWQELEAAKIRAKNYRDRHKGNSHDPPVTETSRENNGKVTPYSSSSTSSSTSDLKRLIDACVREHASFDARLVEIAVIETMMRRKGSANEAKSIKSARYFDEEIKQMCSKKGGGALGDRAVDALLHRRRDQIAREVLSNREGEAMAQPTK